MMTPDRSLRAATQRDYKQRLLRVLMHLQRHLDAPLSLEDLATVACFSPHHFHRIFSGMVGETVQAHVRRLRLERAANQLRRTRLPVLAIALAAGYETQSSFTRAFQTAFGAAPGRYRSRHEPLPPPTVPAPSGVHYSATGEPLRAFRIRPFRSPHIMKVEIVQQPPLRVAFLRHIGPYQNCGVVWEKMGAALGPAGRLGGGAQMIGVGHDNPEVTPAEHLRYDACVTVPPDFAPFGELGVQIIAGGPYARHTHEGPYDGLAAKYQRLLGEWLPRSGRELRFEPCYEIYVNTPGNTAPADLRTEIYLPLV